MLTRLTESNETLFQMKDATDSSFNEFQLHMDRRLKNYVVYQKPTLKTVHTQTNETIIEVDIHCHRNEISEKQSCPTNETIVELDVQCHRTEIAEKQSGPTVIGSEERSISSDVIIVIEEIASDPEWRIIWVLISIRAWNDKGNQKNDPAGSRVTVGRVKHLLYHL